MLSSRVKSVLVFVPLILAMIALGGVVYDLFFLAVILVGACEYHRLLKTMGYYSSLPLLLVTVAIFIIQRMFLPAFYSELSLMIALTANAVMALLRYEQGDSQAALLFALHLAGSVYLGWLGSYFISIGHLPNGAYWTLIAFVIIWLVDMCAYFIGTKYGSRKMSLRLSPKKTWEGFAAGVAGGVVGGLLLSLLLRPWLPGFFFYKGIILGLLIGGLTPIGDVFISMLKRIAGVKDSGNLIPGHGGVLDRIDTWMWAMMMAYYLILLFGAG